MSLLRTPSAGPGPPARKGCRSRLRGREVLVCRSVPGAARARRIARYQTARSAAGARRPRAMHARGPRTANDLTARRGCLPGREEGRLGRDPGDGAHDTRVRVGDRLNAGRQVHRYPATGTLAPCSALQSSLVPPRESARRPRARWPSAAGIAFSSPAARSGCMRSRPRSAPRSSPATSVTAPPSRRSERGCSSGIRQSTRSSTTPELRHASRCPRSTSTSSRRLRASTTSAASG